MQNNKTELRKKAVRTGKEKRYAAIVAESTVLSISQLAEKYNMTESEIAFIINGGH